MSNVAELKDFYPFDADVIGRVLEAAGWQNERSFKQLADYYCVGSGPTIVPGDDGHKPFEVLTIVPKTDFDERHARVYHLPMSMPIDPCMTMRAIRLFGADSSSPLTLIGNPSAAGHKFGKLRYHDMPKVWSGNLKPVVDPLLSYLSSRAITHTDQLGFSYGADKAAATSARAIDHGISVVKGVWMEPVASLARGPGIIGLARLGIDFIGAGKVFDDYVKACKSEPLNEARKKSDVGLLRYLLGLGRLSNLAIANALAHGAFEARATSALESNPKMNSAIAWGTASELVSDSVITALTDRLKCMFGSRVNSMPIKGMHHAGGDHIDLHAAIVLQATKNMSAVS